MIGDLVLNDTPRPELMPRYFVGKGWPSLKCKTGRDYYFDTAAVAQYACVETNTWKRLR